MTQLTLQLRPNVTVLAVLVDDTDGGFKLNGDQLLFSGEKYGVGYAGFKVLPPGKWEIISLLREVSEEVAAGLCDRYAEMGTFPCYKVPNKSLWLHTGKQCITEAITAAGGDPQANWLLLKQIQ